MVLAERLIYGKYGAARGPVVRVFKTRREILKQITKLYSIEFRKKEMNDVSETIVISL